MTPCPVPRAPYVREGPMGRVRSLARKLASLGAGEVGAVGQAPKAELPVPDLAEIFASPALAIAVPGTGSRPAGAAGWRKI